MLTNTSAGKKYKFPLLIGLLFLVSGLLLNTFGSQNFYSYDDDDYFAVSTSIAFGHPLNYSHEYVTGDGTPTHPIGAGILAAPFVFFGSVVDRLTHSPLAKNRTVNNRDFSWSLLGFEIATQFYFLLGLLILFHLGKNKSDPKTSFKATILILFSSNLFPYVFDRPIMSHTYEFFLTSLALSILLTRKKISRKLAIIYGALLAMLALTRYNDLLIGIAFLMVFHLRNTCEKRRSTIYSALSFLATLLILRILPMAYSGFKGTDLRSGTNLTDVMHIPSFSHAIGRVIHVFFGLDMGLIFTAGSTIIGFIILIPFIFKKWNWLLGLSLLSNLYVVITWTEFGSFYGYRYLVFTLYPFAFLGILKLFNVEMIKARVLKYLLYLATFVNLYSLIAWQTAPSYRLNSSDYEAPYYQKNSLSGLSHFNISPILTHVKFGIIEFWKSFQIQNIQVLNIGEIHFSAHQILWLQIKYLSPLITLIFFFAAWYIWDHLIAPRKNLQFLN